MNLCDVFPPDEFERVFMRYVPAADVAAENLRLKKRKIELEPYELIVAEFIGDDKFMPVMSTLLCMHDSFRRRTPPRSLSDLVSPEEFRAEMVTTLETAREPHPMVIPYVAAVNKLGASCSWFAAVMGTLALLQRVLERKTVQ